MDHSEFPSSSGNPKPLAPEVPFIWPEARILSSMMAYESTPPTRKLFSEADLISGVLVGTTDGTVEWLEELVKGDVKRRLRLVLVLFPAGPTRAAHLRALHRISSSASVDVLDLRLLPFAHLVGADCQQARLPPTVIQAYDTKTGRTVMSIGSVGDLGYDDAFLGSLNFVFEPDAALRDSWRKWFQYTLSSAASLTEDTLAIPHLSPAKGDQAAQQLWAAYELACRTPSVAATTRPRVDPETGNVAADAVGNAVVEWDDGDTALEPLAYIFQQVYSNGWLVTMEAGTRIKPLRIPVKATLMGQQAEQIVGAVTRKQAFSLKVLDTVADQAFEKCRNVTDVVELLSCPLSQGNRWLQGTARSLLDQELESRSNKGLKALRAALGADDISCDSARAILEEILQSGKEALTTSVRHSLAGQPLTKENAKEVLDKQQTSVDPQVRAVTRAAADRAAVAQFVVNRTESIRRDLNGMYRDLGQGDVVPEDKVKMVLREVADRLERALGVRIAPRAVYNRVTAPDLTANGAPENWNQPLSLLERSARGLRESLVDPFFRRRFSGLSFSPEEFRIACNAFGDTTVTNPRLGVAEAELNTIAEIMDSERSGKDKCQGLWRLVTMGEVPIDSNSDRT